MLSPRLQVTLDSLRKLLRRGATNHTERLLARTRPADIALLMRFLDERERRRAFDMLPSDEVRSETLGELDSHLKTEILEGRPIEELVRIYEYMSTDDQADLLNDLSDELRQALLDALKPDEAEEIEDLLQHAPDTAGGIMSPDFFAMHEDQTVEETIAALQSADVEMAFYVYVVSENDVLVGVLSLRSLVTHAPKTPLCDLMVSDVVSVQLETDQEEVARLASRYNLLAIPVVDESNRLVGIVTIDDVIDVIREEATEDILRMAGADESVYESPSLLHNFCSRAPWLAATWVGGILSSLLMGVFESEIGKMALLATFVPIVLGMGGNVGSQTATIMVRGLATGRISSDVGWRYLLREVAVGLVLGALYGLCLGVYTFFTQGSAMITLSISVCVSLFASMTVAAGVGALTPLVFERLKVDPAVATNPIVTTLVDLLGTFVYFMTSKIIIGL